MTTNITLPKIDDFAVNEAYKTLRTNLLWNVDKKVICITSSLPEEGKSSIALNLANSFAEQGKTVLLIDADIRKSVMNNRLKVPKIGGGLSEFLAGQKGATDIICSTDVHGLNIIFAGAYPPNPSELLGGKRFELLIEKTRSEFDYIIIDTPPIGSVVDAAIVAKVCDGILMVVEAGRIETKMLKRNFVQLEQSGCPILGCVMNMVSRKTDSYYGKYYGSYYSDKK